MNKIATYVHVCVPWAWDEVVRRWGELWLFSVFFFLISSCGFLLKSISSKREKKRHCINVNMKIYDLCVKAM